MKVADLVCEIEKGYYKDSPILHGDLIALDGKDGKVLFDTLRNKPERISMYANGEIISLWSDVRLCKGIAFGDFFKPVMKCYVSHNSWLKESEGKE